MQLDFNVKEDSQAKPQEEGNILAKTLGTEGVCQTGMGRVFQRIKIASARNLHLEKAQSFEKQSKCGFR